MEIYEIIDYFSYYYDIIDIMICSCLSPILNVIKIITIDLSFFLVKYFGSNIWNGIDNINYEIKC